MAFPKSQLDASSDRRAFNGRLPSAGSGAVQSRSWSVGPNGGAGWAGPIGAGAANPVQIDRSAQDAFTAGAMPASLRDGSGASWNYSTNPLEYAAAAGLVPASEQDAANLLKYPELALHGLAGTANQDVGRFHSSAHIVGPRTIHAVGGANTPAACRCTFRMIAGRL
ncbi:hypothetical protein OKW28_005910 [Paraburkholderia sp. 40]